MKKLLFVCALLASFCLSSFVLNNSYENHIASPTQSPFGRSGICGTWRLQAVDHGYGWETPSSKERYTMTISSNGRWTSSTNHSGSCHIDRYGNIWLDNIESECIRYQDGCLFLYNAKHDYTQRLTKVR